MLLLLFLFFLVSFLVSTPVLSMAPSIADTAPTADPPRARACDPDRLAGARVTTSAAFTHRGSEYSSVTSTTDITIPTAWDRTPDLLLDTRSALYRDALRCLLGKGSDSPEGFYDDEWRLKPLSVTLEKGGLAVHYEAVAWVQQLGTYDVGLWRLTAERDVWSVQLRPPPSLAEATWETVRVRLGGPAAMSASPSPTFGKKRTDLSWRHKKPNEVPYVEFRPPAQQQWAAIAWSPGQTWGVLGPDGASGAFAMFATGALAMIAGRRLRRGLGRHPMPEEKAALRLLRSWALILMLLGLVVYLGDDLYRLVQQLLGGEGDYKETVPLYSMVCIGVALCLFGKLRRPLIVTVCVLALGIIALRLSAELSQSGLLPTGDVLVSPVGEWMAVLVHTVLIFLCFLGVVSSGQRLMLLDGRNLPQWVMVCAAVATSGLTMLWAFLAFDGTWERWTWLADSTWQSYGVLRLSEYHWWWSGFAADVLPVLGDIIVLLTPLALAGVLRVCRLERHEEDSFAPSEAERAFLVIFFAIVVLPGSAWYFGFSGYVMELVLGICAAWALLALGRSKSVLEQPTAANAPLGKLISRTDRSQWLRLARHYRELQSRLRHPGTASASGQTSSQEAVEREIDQLDQCLPNGVSPVDVPFALGPMATWWGNACRCALIACFLGLPATGLMYWIDGVSNESWAVWTQASSGFLLVVLDIAYWHVTWVGGGFFLGALWRDLPGRYGPTKAFSVAVAFAVPLGAHLVIAEITGASTHGVMPSLAAFASVMTFTGLVMDAQTFQSERSYWPSRTSLITHIYQMRFGSVAFFLAQVVALATIWKTFRDGGPPAPPR